MLKSRGEAMEILPNDNEVVEVIVLELVNEKKFDSSMESRLKEYFDDDIDYSFIRLASSIRSAQGYHYTKSDHTHRLRELGKDMKYRVAVRVIEYYWDRHKDTVFNRWDIPDKARYLYETPEKPEVVHKVDMTEIELRVLSQYADCANQTSQKVESIINRGRTVDDIKEYFGMYKQGRWAWNTMRGKLEGHLGIDWRSRNESNTALIDMFVLKFYSKFFTNLYAREFTRWDIPPQCRYLFEPEEFESKNDWVDIRGNGQNSTHDDHLDALQFAPCERRFMHKFIKPKEDSIMLDIKTVVRISGEDASDFSDDKLIGLIPRVESEIKTLQEIEAKSKKIDAKIEAHKANIEKLVKILDSRG